MFKCMHAKTGCCWAFSAVAATEGIVKLRTGKLISLSEQELLDCDVDDTNRGCNGGAMQDAFEFIATNGGLATEVAYPYTASEGTCTGATKLPTLSAIKGYEAVPPNSESSLLKAVSGQPVAAALDGGGSDFRFYSGGIFTGYCGTDLNHAVTIVGYGTTAQGTDYWLLKNSWGASWGENGYMRMLRHVHAAQGLCGIAMDASYPIA